MLRGEEIDTRKQVQCAPSTSAVQCRCPSSVVCMSTAAPTPVGAPWAGDGMFVSFSNPVPIASRFRRLFHPHSAHCIIPGYATDRGREKLRLTLVSHSSHLYCVDKRRRQKHVSLTSRLTGRLHGTIVGPTGRSDPGYVRLSVRPVGQTGRTD